MNGVQTRFKCKLDVKRCKRFVFPPSSLLPRSNALKTKAIRYFQTDRTLTRIVSPPLYKNLTLYANNYFTQTEEEPFKYFNYSSHSTGHTFEVGAGYMLSEKFPLSVSWYTTFAGNDYRENGKRAWSSYCELSYPFSVKDVNMSVEAGFTPWESMYSDKFNVVNIGLSATKEIKITSNFSLPIFGKLIANPYEEQLYFVFGITL